VVTAQHSHAAQRHGGQRPGVRRILHHSLINVSELHSINEFWYNRQEQKKTRQLAIF
jgi:hypothetical protein